jgi:hypothetical protein
MEVWQGARRIAQLGTPTQGSTGPTSSVSRGPMLVRSAASTTREYRRLLAKQAEAGRRTMEKSRVRNFSRGLGNATRRRSREVSAKR